MRHGGLHEDRQTDRVVLLPMLLIEFIAASYLPGCGVDLAVVWTWPWYGPAM